MITRPCTYCGATFEDGTAGRFQHSGPRRRHEQRCVTATPQARAYFLEHRDWPRSAARLGTPAQRQRWKKTYRERRQAERSA